MHVHERFLRRGEVAPAPGAGRLAEEGEHLGNVREPPGVLLGEDDRAVREHVVLALGALLSGRFVSRLVQLGRETRGPNVIAVSDGAVLDQDARHGANLTLA